MRDRESARDRERERERERARERERERERADLREVPTEGAERARKVVHLREVVALVENDLIHHIRFSQPSR
jgi:hypothetical protein